jgi:prophage tail gpP-like protein
MSVELRVGGQRLSAFERGSLQLTMQEAANSFDVDYVADSRASSERLIYPGDAVSVLIGEETVLEGWVDTVDDEDSHEQSKFAAAGRSKAGDLVDCTSLRAPGSWSNATVDRIAMDVAAPFAVGVYVDGSPGDPIAAFSVQKGETAYETIARAALKRGLIAYSVGGDLVLARAGSTRSRTVLERGRNLVRSARSESHYARYSDYVLRAQARSTETRWGASASQLQHSVKDPAIKRYRPLLVQREAHSGIDLEHQAYLEKNQRAGRGQRIQAVVEGHITEEGYAWRPNTLVRLRNPVLGVDATLLVVVVRFRFGATDAEETELELARPEAFDLGKYPAIGRGERWT